MDEDNLTEEEREIEERDDVDGEEAHRIGEFRELRDIMEDVRSMLQGHIEDVNKRFDGVATSIAALTEEGAVIREADGDNAEAVLIDALDYPSSFDVITPLDDLDLNM